MSEVDHNDTVKAMMTTTMTKQTAIKLYFFFFVLMRLLNNWINLFLMFCIESLIKSHILFHNPVKYFEIEFQIQSFVNRRYNFIYIFTAM